MSKAANENELLKRGSKRAKSHEQNELELKLVIGAVRRLLDRIEDAVPLINLAITTSGVNLSTNLPATVSPSRLLQASTFLTAADSLYAGAKCDAVQVGPVYVLSLYMLFASHAGRPHDEDGIRETTWKEVIHKARVKLVRVPLNSLYHLPGDESPPNAEDSGYFPQSIPGEAASLEFAYQLLLIEDLDDGRVHTFDEHELEPGPFEDVALAGIRDVVPIHQISKIFYADTGKILNIGTEGETNSPVLLIKRDIHAEPPRRMMERQHTDYYDDEFEDYDEGQATYEDDRPSNGIPDEHDEQAELDAQIRRESTPLPLENEKEPLVASPSRWRLPVDLDPEWLAFEVYAEDPESDDEEEEAASESAQSRPPSSRHGSVDPSLSGAFSSLNISSPSPASTSSKALHAPIQTGLASAPTGPIKTSLSLLEMLIRLTALQQFRQASHLTIEDEVLNFFLEDSATTGAGANAESRQRIRRDARRRVGFDPYDESPIKRRGEEYLAHPRSAAESWTPVDAREGSYYNDANSGDEYGEGRYSSPGFVRESIENQYLRYESSAGNSRRSPSVPSSPSPQLRPGGPQNTKSSPVIGRPSSSLRHSVTTPPPASAGKGRRTLLKGQNENRLRSPLTKEFHSTGGGEGDSALGTSPSFVRPKKEESEGEGGRKQ